MSELVHIITATDPAVRNRSLDDFCRSATAAQLVDECAALDQFRRHNDNLYARVRALFFLYAIYRFHLPVKLEQRIGGYIPFEGYTLLLRRRFEEAIDLFLAVQANQDKPQSTNLDTAWQNQSGGMSQRISRVDAPSLSGNCATTPKGLTDGLCSALAQAYHNLGFQTLADQVRRSVRSVRGNQWMFRVGHPADHPLRIRPELMTRTNASAGLFPILRESTPVRMDLTHSGWSDIFFLGMDLPEGARVLNVSIDLCVREEDTETQPKPPIETYFRIIDEPVLRLVSVDLDATAEIMQLADVFDFAKDYLGLLKASVIASGIVPPGSEGAGQPLSELLARLIGPGRGIELVSQVNGIPKGSRLAVSTNLLASLIAVCMRATGQTQSLTGPLTEQERRTVAARAILGEWLGGSGGGWQDSGGVWPGMKVIEGVEASQGDPEFGVSRGRLLPNHRILDTQEVTETTRAHLQDSLVLVHGGMAQDVGPILEMVTEKYLLRSEVAWQARQEAIQIIDQLLVHLQKGDVRAVGAATHRNFTRPLQAIIPWASNLYTETLIERVQERFGDQFWGFWMMGGMSGGGMGFMFAPEAKLEAQDALLSIMHATKKRFETAIPFAMEPVVYDFAINEQGTVAELLRDDSALMPPGYYVQTLPKLLRFEQRELSPLRRAELDRFGSACRTDRTLSGMVQTLFDRLLPGEDQTDAGELSLDALLEKYGFDRVQHEQIRADLRSGRIGLAQNRLPVSSTIEDVLPKDVDDLRSAEETHSAEEPMVVNGQGKWQSWREAGEAALGEGRAAVVTLAGGAGSRWTQGAGVVKALNPFCRLGGAHRTFLEIHLAKSRAVSCRYGMPVPHIITTSYLTHDPIATVLAAERSYGYEGPLRLSPGRYVGLRLIPMARDLRFAWEEMPQQLLDEQAQKVQDSLRAALIGWVNQMGEGSDYRDNVPMQCLHPVGHWYEIPNLLHNGVLLALLDERPQLQHLMVHNVDTVGVTLDPLVFGYHIVRGKAWTSEVITRRVEDRGGGLARVNGRPRLIEGLALPREEVEFALSYYNTGTSWIAIDPLLVCFGLTRADLRDQAKVGEAVRRVAARMPTYITLKDVKKRWGKGQEDIYPLAQFEKLWGDMTALPEMDCQYVVVSRPRGQQLKEVAQLDGWLRDGSAAYVASLCDWNDV